MNVESACEYCCPECFEHPTPRAIVEEESRAVGTCDFCESTGVPLLRVAALYDAFCNATGIYHAVDQGGSIPPWSEPFESGQPLHVLLDEDWRVFSEKLVGLDRAADLLQAILESGWDDDSGEPIPSKNELFVRASFWLYESPAESWQAFSYNIRQEESLQHELPPALYEDIYCLQKEIHAGRSILFRARRGFEEGEWGRKEPYSGSKIGPPPPENAMPGRANKRCDVVLYAAEDEQTAVAETRPPRGLLVSVGEFAIRRSYPHP
jgi:RES domain-containing protein